jgi:secreted PhoX family phosphatase
MSNSSFPLNRRRFIGGAAAAAAAATVASTGSPFSALGAHAASAPQTRSPRKQSAGGGYGPIAPVRDQATGLELLCLPAGFEYISYGWTNDPMDDGTPTPGSHDGMAAFWSKGRALVVRNHERGNGTPFTNAAVYDPTSAGGTTNLVFHPGEGRWESSYASLSGTIRNCAGGPTPWGSWLTCEETTQVNNAGTADEMRHGYVFDVPADGLSDALPLPGLGRFSHEAVAVDPATGIVYLTEDATPSGFYRFVPTTPGDLTSGRLQMLAIAGVPTTYSAGTGTTWGVTDWVTIDTPDPAPGELSTVRQGLAKGGSAITRGEGVWYGNGHIYFISTSGGPVGQGQVFDYDPIADTLTVMFASPSADVLNAPDNCCITPQGGLVLCEDGSGEEFMHGLTADGEIFQLAKNNADLTAGTAGKPVNAQDYRGSEWAGATFEVKHGKWLFANLQSPGVTFAITGPWSDGGL